LSAEINALLIAEGGVNIDENLLGSITTHASGPGVGPKSFFSKFDDYRVRPRIKKSSKYIAALEGDEAVIREGKREIIRGRLEDAHTHCPKQAYVAVSEECVFDCKYCPFPLLEARTKSTKEIEK